MRALLTLGSLLIVLAVVVLSVRSQLAANRRFLPSAAASATASAPSGGPSPTVSQFQQELDKTMRDAAQRNAERAASAGEDGTR